MKDLLKLLPKILDFINKLKQFSVLLKYIPMLLIGGVICFGLYYVYAVIGFDSYACVNNEVYKKITAESSVYVYKGGQCVSIEKTPAINLDSIKKFVEN